MNEGTFIVHDSVVTESPSRIVSRLDRMLHDNQILYNEEDSSINGNSLNMMLNAQQNGKGPVIYRGNYDDDNQSLYHNIINLH